MAPRAAQGLPLLGARARRIKRAFDLAFAIPMLVLAMPLLFALAAMIRCSSPGPSLYRQVRCGRGGRPFVLYKLRTMHVGDQTDAEPGWTRRDDPRRTALGAVLRRFNLDELPQLWNVIRGDMSLVGPRPERPELVVRFNREIHGYGSRHLVLPGITGLAQVKGWRGDTCLRERLRCDLDYLRRWSPGLDLVILARTPVALRNAY